MKKFTSIIVFFISLSSINAQSVPKELEDISLEMLRERESPSDSTAVAEVLYEKGKISFSILESWVYNFEVVRRIKIYSQDGYDKANVEIPYYVGKYKTVEESVKNVKGYVYFEENGKVKKEKLRNRDVFEIDLSGLYRAKRFTLPKIQDGVIIEYSYTIESPNINSLPKWIFQNSIPTRYSEFKTYIPEEYISYSLKTRGYIPIKTNIEYADLPVFRRSSRGYIDFKTKVSEHYVTDLPKIEKEPYVNNITNYLPSVSYELSSYRIGRYSEVESRSRSWEDVAKTLVETDSYDKEISRTKYFEEDLKKKLDGIAIPQEKMKAIFEFVKNKMTWNDEERVFTSDKLHKVYEKGIGNSADINIMLIAMLRAQNLNANPVLSSTISNGIPIFPTLNGFNYVFAHVDLNGKSYLLDATDDFSSVNTLPDRTLNWEGTLIKQNGFEKIKLIPNSTSTKKFQVQAELSETGEINGKCRIISMDQYGWRERRNIDRRSDEDIKLRYQQNYNIQQIKDISNTNLKDTSKPFLEGFSFSDKEKYVEQIGDKIYLTPMLFLRSNENPFKEEERKYPIDFTFPRNVEYLLSISIPNGYKVDYIPEKSILELNDSASLTYLIEVQSNQIMVKVQHEIKSPLFLPQDYKNLRDFYISLMNKENEKIVLVKS